MNGAKLRAPIKSSSSPYHLRNVEWDRREALLLYDSTFDDQLNGVSVSAIIKRIFIIASRRHLSVLFLGG